MLYFLFFLFFYKSLEKSDVYFTKDVNSSLVTIFRKLNVQLGENVALKVHTGEPGGEYYLKPDYLQEIYNYTNGTFIESNAAYNGIRNTTETHKKYLKESGWDNEIRKTIILDENNITIIRDNKEKNQIIKENIVGEHLKDYKDCIVLTHFKGNKLAGFGGALKHLATGFASQNGKAQIYTSGEIKNWTELNITENFTVDENFTRSMAEAASTVVQYFRENKGKIVFINVMSNISLDCDCVGARARAPKIDDLGILASTDPVALDRACLDLIKKRNNTNHSGEHDLLEQIKNTSGENIINVAVKIDLGSEQYNFIDIDENKRTVLGLILFLCIIISSVLIAGILAYCLGKKGKNSKEKNKLVEKNDEE